ncbi:HpcH/HpaI aldolase/citrate lyase family protein [Arenibaculum pallidiluteum]|uniref:HpcH/HpaI aldolase/citrate lyase family protein n=1 Tax=Arenibaculum pallidiluteum TaxID=2812559 RepID=UPI001A966D1C|nr:CoA ester lyase [Arenibaculum pallidiluteum]
MPEPRLRRTLLLTPGNRPERLQKAVGLGADCVVFDLEDGVPPDGKEAAREAVAGALRSLDFRGCERAVRINAIGTQEAARDLEMLPLDRVDSIMVPKVEHAAAVRQLETMLRAAERRPGREDVPELILTLETPRGILSALGLADASPRATALFFGSGDYTAATGGTVSAEALLFPRSMVVAAAAATGMQAIDAAFFTAVKDPDATHADAVSARDLGFAGKVVFHPAQVPVVNQVFAPTVAEIERAHRIVTAYREGVERGSGVSVVEGTFVAIDMLPPAERTLRMARQVALREGPSHAES